MVVVEADQFTWNMIPTWRMRQDCAQVMPCCNLMRKAAHKWLRILNPSSYPQVAESGTTIGEVIAVTVVEAYVSPELNDDQNWLGEVQRE